MTIREAVTLKLKEMGLDPWPGEYRDIKPASKISPLYMGIASVVNPNWRYLLENDSKAFTAFWTTIDNEVESRGYYAEGESHNTPLILTDPDAPQPEPDKPVTLGDLACEERLRQTQAMLDSANLYIAKLKNEIAERQKREENYINVFLRINEQVDSVLVKEE